MGPKTKITNVNLAIGEKDGNLCVHEVHMQTTELSEYYKLSMKELKGLSKAHSMLIRDRLESDGYTLLFLVAAVGLANKPLHRYAFTTVFNPHMDTLLNGDIRCLLVREYMNQTRIAAKSDLQAYTIYEDYQAITNYIKDNNIA
tara:strand:- start:199 stop:630 length:432 start_codon:yes stop_codon:yes gene_type:complete